MSILFVHERASFTGGVEQNIADSVRAFRTNKIECHLAYNPMMPVDQAFLGLFDSSHACSELSATPSILSTPTLGEIASSTGARTAYLHKLPTLPSSLLAARIRTVQMVHDHDLCCPRKHKYFLRNSQICTKPLGIHCYADLAFVARDRNSRTGIRFESIAAKKRELRRRHSLDLSIVASTFMRDELVRNGFAADRVRTIPLAVPEMPVKIVNLPTTVPVILFVGQLIRGKGVDLLLRALVHLKGPYRAIVIGKGNAEQSLRSLRDELGLQHLVEFAGWVPNQDLPRYYSQADVLAVPSRWPEPFGLVGLEAMRYGKPVVAFEVGGIPDWLHHERNGLLAPAGDVRSFAACLQRLTTDRRLAAQYGAAGSQELKRHFNLTRYIAQLQAALLPNSTTAMQKECA